MACEDCFEVGFVGLVLGRNYVWCLVIIFIFIGFGQAEKKKCGGCLIKSHQFGMEMEVTKEDSFHREGRFSLSNTDVL